jgi:hypothetical protein
MDLDRPPSPLGASAQVEKDHDAVSSKPITIETEDPAAPSQAIQPGHDAATRSPSMDLGTEAMVKELSKSEVPGAEDASQKLRVLESAVDDIKARTPRPSSPARLRLFPKRLPVRTIVKSMETDTGSKGSNLAERPTTASSERRSPTPTSGPSSRPTTPASRPTTPAPDQRPEKEVPTGRTEISLPAPIPSENPPSVPEKENAPTKSETDPSIATVGGHVTSRNTLATTSQATEALAAAAADALSKPNSLVKDLTAVETTAKTETALEDLPSLKSQAPIQFPAELRKQASISGDEAETKAKAPDGKVITAPLASSQPASDSSNVEESVTPLNTPESFDGNQLPSVDVTPDSKLPESQLTVQEIYYPRLSEPSDPPQSPLPQLPSAKSQEAQKSQRSVEQESDGSLSRRPSNDFPILRNSPSQTSRGSLIRSTTPDILTRRTSRDRLSRNPAPPANLSSTLPSRQLSLKLPVNPHSGFSQSGRISPSGRSPTPDTTRRVSQDRPARSPTPGLGDRESIRESISSRRISHDVPINRQSSINSLRKSGRASPYMIRSATPDNYLRGSLRAPSPAPITPLDFLAALAAQERLVLELKEAQQQAEVDLEQLKTEWANQDPYEKQDTLRLVEGLLRQEEEAQPHRNSSQKDVEKKVEEPEISSPPNSDSSGTGDVKASPNGEVKVRQRKVFQGSREMRPLSLLSPNETNSRASSPKPGPKRTDDTEVHVEETDTRAPSPMPESEPGPEFGRDLRSDLRTDLRLESEVESEAVMEAESELELVSELDHRFKERSDALSIIQEEASTKSIKHDSMPMPPLPIDDGFMRTSLQLASDLREGLETFLEDLKQASVAEKALTAPETEAKPSTSTPEPPRKKSRKHSKRERGDQPKSPLPELKSSGSLIKTTLVKGEGDHHQSAFVDLDIDFFDNELWKEPSIKSPTLLTPKSMQSPSPVSPILSSKSTALVSPKRDDKSSKQSPKPLSKPRRRYLNMSSDENLPVYGSQPNHESQPKRKSPTSSSDTASTRRGSTSTNRSNPRSSTT